MWIIDKLREIFEVNTFEPQEKAEDLDPTVRAGWEEWKDICTGKQNREEPAPRR